MSKLTLTDLVSLQNETTAVSAVNANNASTRIALDNTLSRNGQSPNKMAAVLDMNSNRIINLPVATSDDEPVRKHEFDLISNGYLGNNILLGTNHEINVSSGGGTSTFSLPSIIDLTGKAITGQPTSSAAFNLVNAADYGVGVGVVDNGPLINNIINNILPVDGGIIDLPFGFLNFTTTIDFSAKKKSITLRGKGGCNSGGFAATALRYNGTGATTAINMNDCVGCTIQDIQIASQIGAGHTGYLISMSHITNDPIQNRIINCGILGNGTTSNGIDLRGSTVTTIENCILGGLVVSVLGRDNVNQVTNGYSIRVSIKNCTFVSGVTDYYILNPDNNWSIEGCVFENNLAAKPCGILCLAAVPFQTLSIKNNWFADATAGPAAWMDIAGDTLVLTGNFFSTQGGHGNYAIILEDVDTAVIKGNHFEGFLGGIAFNGVSNNIDISPNRYTACINKILNFIPGHPTGGVSPDTGWHLLPNGCIMQYGMTPITVPTPVTITYPKLMTQPAISIQLTVKNPTGGANTLYVGNSTTSNFVINSEGIAGGGGTIYWTAIGII